jgi:hypothetical protein
MKEILTYQLGNRGRRYSARPHSFLQQVSGQIFKDDRERFSSTSEICFVVLAYWLGPKKENNIEDPITLHIHFYLLWD